MYHALFVSVVRTLKTAHCTLEIFFQFLLVVTLRLLHDDHEGRRWGRTAYITAIADTENSRLVHSSLLKHAGLSKTNNRVSETHRPCAR